jgi:hypothetical protein
VRGCGFRPRPRQQQHVKPFAGMARSVRLPPSCASRVPAGLDERAWPVARLPPLASPVLWFAGGCGFHPPAAICWIRQVNAASHINDAILCWSPRWTRLACVACGAASASGLALSNGAQGGAASALLCSESFRRWARLPSTWADTFRAERTLHLRGRRVRLPSSGRANTKQNCAVGCGFLPPAQR